MSPSEGSIYCQVNKSAWPSTVVNNKLSLVVSKVEEHFILLPLCRHAPLGHDIQSCGIHLNFLAVGDIL